MGPSAAARTGLQPIAVAREYFGIGFGSSHLGKILWESTLHRNIMIFSYDNVYCMKCIGLKFQTLDLNSQFQI